MKLLNFENWTNGEPQCPNASTTPITAMGCRQCLHLSVVQLKGKHCRKPHCRNGVVGTFQHGQLLHLQLSRSKQVQNLASV